MSDDTPRPRRRPTPRVRLATGKDAEYVQEAFNKSLAPFYGGDHRAHARRVLATHLAGGEDTRGLLSTKQVLLVLWEGRARRGVLNLVFKRQGTCKISPLILYPEGERSRGLGALLLSTAEQYARDGGARQLYCTVAESNRHAIMFFLSSGFVVCGRSDGQYKPGEVEVMLRRPLELQTVKLEQDEVISVTEAKDPYSRREAVHLISILNPWQLGTDYIRRLERQMPLSLNDVASEATDIGPWTFCARSRGGRCRAAAVAELKKGGAVKVVALAAEDKAAHRAMILDLPSLLAARGRKAFLHAPFEAELVPILQDAGWQFEAHLPSAYGQGVVTEQWGITLDGEGAMRTLRIHRRYLELIESGRKTLEIRVGYDNIKRIRAGDFLKLMSSSQSTTRVVKDVREYPTFEEMLDNEPLQNALPGMTRADALRQLREFYPPEKERLGVYVLELTEVS